MKRFTKAWAALAAGAPVVLASGLITGSAAVWIATGIATGTAVLAVIAAPKNATKAE